MRKLIRNTDTAAIMEDTKLPDGEQSGPQLRILAERAWNMHRETEDEAVPHLVRPSIPILFFGDSLGYFGSPLKVITVGLNPSCQEFPDASPFSRFPSAGHLSREANLDIDSYLASLNNYFRTLPYKAWFDPSFEQLLVGMGTSYYPGRPSVSLHTDLCSPLTTDPTWSGLKTCDQDVLGIKGRSLWHDLVEALQPDFVLVSVRRNYLDHVRFQAMDEPRTIHTVHRKKNGQLRQKPYCVKVVRRRLDSGKKPLFVFGRAMQTPFGSVSGADKRLIGKALLLKESQLG